MQIHLFGYLSLTHWRLMSADFFSLYGSKTRDWHYQSAMCISTIQSQRPKQTRLSAEQNEHFQNWSRNKEFCIMLTGCLLSADPTNQSDKNGRNPQNKFEFLVDSYHLIVGSFQQGISY